MLDALDQIGKPGQGLNYHGCCMPALDCLVADLESHILVLGKFLVKIVRIAAGPGPFVAVPCFVGWYAAGLGYLVAVAGQAD